MKHLCLKILLVFTFCVMNLIAVAQPVGRTIELIGFVMDSFTDYGLEKAKVTLMSTDSTVIDTMSVRNRRPSGYMVSSSFSFKERYFICCAISSKISKEISQFPNFFLK